MTMLDKVQIKAHDKICANENAEIFYVLNQGMFILWEEVEV